MTKEQPMGGQPPRQDHASNPKRDQFREEYRALLDRRDKGEADDEQIEHAEFDVLSADPDRAIAAFEVFDDPAHLLLLRDIITQTKSEEVKVELARRMDPTSNIISLLESDKNRPHRFHRDSSFYIQTARAQIEQMIAACTGETKTILEGKLALYNATVKKTEDAIPVEELDKGTLEGAFGHMSLYKLRTGDEKVILWLLAHAGIDNRQINVKIVETAEKRTISLSRVGQTEPIYVHVVEMEDQE